MYIPCSLGYSIHALFLLPHKIEIEGVGKHLELEADFCEDLEADFWRGCVIAHLLLSSISETKVYAFVWWCC